MMGNCGDKTGKNCAGMACTACPDYLEGSAQATLEAGCALYCRWYDTGQPQMSGKDVAYELVSLMRKALSEIKKGELPMV